MSDVVVLDPELYVVDTKNGAQTTNFGDNIPKIFANLKQHDQPLVIWFHGALVTRQNGLDGAHLGLYGNSVLPGFLAENAEAIYYVYESGPFYEGLKGATYLLADDLIQSKIGHIEALIRPFIHIDIDGVIRNVVAGFVTKATDGIAAFLKRLKGDEGVRMRLQGLASGTGNAFAFQALSNPESVTEEQYARAKAHAELLSKLTPVSASRNSFDFAMNIDFGSLLIQFGIRAVNVAKRVIQRIHAGRDHGLTQTIIEEIVREYITVGPETWRQIKDEVGRSFADSSDAAGTRLIAGLRSYMAVHPQRKVFLVGHSTGAIYLANFVMKSQDMGLDTKYRMRLLAGAATMDLYNDLTQKANDKVVSIVNFGMGDIPTDKDHNYEHEEYLFSVPPIDKTPVQYLYKGSLLYMVSGALETDFDQPLMGMQRFYPTDASPNPPGKTKLRRSVIEVWSDTPSSEGVRGCKSHHHGGFPEDPDTFKSILIDP